MKIQCDVCEKAEAKVLCTADEAALCLACDERVHLANKLASMHQRFSLLIPSSPPNHHSPPTLCDICQERKAILFCQQDRAILCRDCDLSIHMLNKLTKNHSRFLLTGIKISATSAVCSSSASSVSDVLQFNSQPSSKKSMSSGSSTMLSPPFSAKLPGSFIPPSVKVNEDVHGQLSTQGVGSTSNMSEYLIHAQPSWNVQEILEFPAAFGFCKDNDFGIPVTSFPTGISEIGIPDVTRQKAKHSLFSPHVGFRDMTRTSSISSNDIWSDDGLTVPQVSPQSEHKKLKTHW